MKHSKEKTPMPLSHYAEREHEKRVAAFLAEADKADLPPPKSGIKPSTAALKPLTAAEEEARTKRIRR